MDFSLAPVRTSNQRDGLELTRPLISVGEDSSLEVEAEPEAALLSAQEYHVILGNRKWIREKNFIDIPPEVEAKLAVQERRGHTVILAAIDGKQDDATFCMFTLLSQFFP